MPHVRKIIRGLAEPEKRAFVFRANFARRNLSAAQKTEKAEAMKGIALELKQLGRTQKQIGMLLAQARSTIAAWLGDIPNVSADNGSTPCSATGYVPDCRIVVPKGAYPAIAARAESGDTQAQIAADVGCSQGRVAQILLAADGDEAAATAEDAPLLAVAKDAKRGRAQRRMKRRTRERGYWRE
jgi:ParB-like chromosome segregation protein Spo0J